MATTHFTKEALSEMKLDAPGETKKRAESEETVSTAASTEDGDHTDGEVDKDRQLIRKDMEAALANVHVPEDVLVYGLDAELKTKEEAKYNVALEQNVRGWLEALSGEERGSSSAAELLPRGAVSTQFWPTSFEAQNQMPCPTADIGRPMSAEQAEQSVCETLKTGFRHIDSAQAYMNEECTGRGIKASGVPRDKPDATSRQLGCVVELSQRIQDLPLEDFRAQIMEPLWQHGVVCVKKQSLSPAEMEILSDHIGTLFRLPGEIEKPHLAEATAVHQLDQADEENTVVFHVDGDFLPEGNRHMITMAFAAKVDTGGQVAGTEFLDTAGAVAGQKGIVFEPTMQALLERSIATTRLTTIWPHLSKYDLETSLGFANEQKHPVVTSHPITGQPCLFVPGDNHVYDDFYSNGCFDINTSSQPEALSAPLLEADEVIELSKWTSVAALWNKIMRYTAANQNHPYHYEHHWETGDLLLWDNHQLVHRRQEKSPNEGKRQINVTFIKHCWH